MSHSFSFDVPVTGPPAEAQARLRDTVVEQLRQVAKMGLASEESNSLAFRPQWGWPLLAALSRRISGETVNLTFTADNGGTRVAISGKVGGGAEKVASQEFWAQTPSAG